MNCWVPACAGMTSLSSANLGTPTKSIYGCPKFSNTSQHHGKLSGNARVGAVLPQDLGAGIIILSLRQTQWRFEQPVSGIDGSAMFQQQSQQDRIPFPGCPMQGRIACLVAGVDVCSGLQQRLYAIRNFSIERVKQGCPVSAIHFIHFSPGLNQDSDKFRLVV